MSDDTKDSPEEMGRLMGEVIAQSMSVEDAIRFKHSLNQDIKYGGKNAKQIEAIHEDSQKQLLHELAEIHKSRYFFPDWFWVVFGLLAGGCVIFLIQHWYVFIAASVTCYCVAKLVYRAGYGEGYFNGFESGHKNGVNTALGITPEEEKEIRERAIEMEMDERLIKNLDERKSD